MAERGENSDSSSDDNSDASLFDSDDEEDDADYAGNFTTFFDFREEHTVYICTRVQQIYSSIELSMYPNGKIVHNHDKHH